MKHLKTLNRYFWKYRTRLFLGVLFIILSNYFAILSPQVTGYIFDLFHDALSGQQDPSTPGNYDPLVARFIAEIEGRMLSFGSMVAIFSAAILGFALLRGFFMFLMRQTIIVMSRHIEFDQKNEVFRHYLKLDLGFYKQHRTGDLMSRISEDVSRVRMYTGPALMYLVNLLFTISFALFYMIRKDWELTLYVLSPLPLLAMAIYYINSVIHRKSEHIQALLSDLTTNAQESYSGIRVIKSFVQEKAMLGFFRKNSEDYRQNAIGLARLEAIYFPLMGLLIGLSTLLTIMIGGIYAVNGTHGVTLGTIVEFVMYVNMLTFPVSAIGWTAAMIQRAAASQKRVNEFLHTEPEILNPPQPLTPPLQGAIRFEHVHFTYPNTGIRALKDFDLSIAPGEKMALIGHTGSGKTTVAQLLLRMFDCTSGRVLLDGRDIRDLELNHLRRSISYVPQDVFLFSDTIADNIRFGVPGSTEEQIRNAARQASVEKDILQFQGQFDTLVGERGVNLSGGQKQRIAIARGLIKSARIIVFDDCLSAVDARTEKEILTQLNELLADRTALIITHRILPFFRFDKIVVLESGAIVEQGTHEELLAAGKYYAALYRHQQSEKDVNKAPDPDLDRF